VNDLHVCPHCGYDLASEAIVEDGDFLYEPRLGVLYRGARLPISPDRHLILATLLKARPRVLTSDALLGAIGSEGDDTLIRSHVSVIRRDLYALGIPNPIETVWGHGRRWAPSAGFLTAQQRRANARGT
jgi:DNA-binding response OmpR family regulator